MSYKWKITDLEEDVCNDYIKLKELDEIIEYYEKELAELEPILKNGMYMVGKTRILDYRKDIILSKINILKAHKEFILYGENVVHSIK